jgi:hypothetical protein
LAFPLIFAEREALIGSLSGRRIAVRAIPWAGSQGNFHSTQSPFPCQSKFPFPLAWIASVSKKSVPKGQSVSWMKLSCRPVFPLLALWEKKILELQQVQAFIRTTFPSGTPA